MFLEAISAPWERWVAVFQKAPDTNLDLVKSFFREANRCPQGVLSAQAYLASKEPVSFLIPCRIDF